MVTHSSIEVLTKEYNCLVKITDDIRQVVEKSKIRNGVVYVITAHTTTGIAVNEGLECLEYDIASSITSGIRKINRLFCTTRRNNVALFIGRDS